MQSIRIRTSVGPLKREVPIIEVNTLGHYLNFNQVVTHDFVHEMVADEFQVGRDDDYVIFVPMLALRQYLMDMVRAVTGDALEELSRGHIDDYRMLTTSSLHYWQEALDQLVAAVAQEADKGKTVETIVISSNDKF